MPDNSGSKIKDEKKFTMHIEHLQSQVALKLILYIFFK